MTIYEQIGGAPAVAAAVDLFYEKLLADPSLSGFFAETDLARLKGHQRAFIGAAMGGPDGYEGRSLGPAHSELGITKGDFDAVVGHLVATLRELEVSEDVIAQVGASLAPLEGDIVSDESPTA